MIIAACENAQLVTCTVYTVHISNSGFYFAVYIFCFSYVDDYKDIERVTDLTNVNREENREFFL